MEKKTVNLGEALSVVFHQGNFLKFLCGAIFLSLPNALLMSAIANRELYMSFNIGKIIGIAGLGLLTFICMIILAVYPLLYMHDRALDKNARFRDWSDSIFSGLAVQVKTFMGYFLISLIFLPIFIPLYFLLIAIMFIPVLGFLLDIVIFIAVLILFLNFWFRIIPYFVKDLKFTSMFKWGEAFRFCKDIHYGAGTIVVLIILYLIVAIISNVIIMNIKNIAIPVLIFAAIMFVNIISFAYMLFCANMFGQFSYNAIEQNMRKTPETLPKEINQDKVAIAVCTIALVILLFIPIVMGGVAAMTLPSLINKQAGVASRTKIMKGLSNYEMVAATYMAEYEKSNIRDLTANNCANIGNYFHIDKQNGCDFTTYDGLYWQFNYDGSATLSDKELNPTQSLKVGVCYDGTINCESEYPDAYDFKNRPLR